MRFALTARALHTVVPAALAMLAIALPADAQLGGVQAPGSHGKPVSSGSNLALGSGGCPPGDTSALTIPLDGTFTVVQMDASGGSGEADPSDPCQRNDDDSSAAIALQFPFDFYGGTFNDVNINNNGNLSFGAHFSTYTSTGFPISGFPMIAPFWGDVDTRDNSGGVVYYRSEPNRFVVTWDHVGYFNSNDDLLNTFQVILTDGTDPLIGLGNNVCFSYGDMQWTTGDASGGSGGLGGSPTTVGANKGDGSTYFQVGLFDQPGTAYDGPDGSNDGVDFLDNSHICFTTGETNVPPIVVDAPEDCLVAEAGETIEFTIIVIGPEGDQLVTLEGTGDDLPAGADTYDFGTMSPGSTTWTYGWNTTAYDVGSYSAEFTATDDGSPPESTTITVCINLTSEEILGGAGQFNVYSTRQLTITNAQTAGRIGAKNNFFILQSQIAYGDVAADSDSMACGRAVHAANGILQAGNIVCGLHFDSLENTFYLANGTLEPRIDDAAWDHDAMVDALYVNSATYGAMASTGTVTDDGYGNLTLAGSGSNPEIFSIACGQLENHSRLIVSADAGSNVLINVSGGAVTPSVFGFDIEGVAANQVLINCYEAYEIDFSVTNLKASLLAPNAKTCITNITVTGNIVGRWIELLSADAQGDLLVGVIPTTTPFTFSLPLQADRDSLSHNLVIRPLTLGDHVDVGVGAHHEGEVLQVTFPSSREREYRSDKIARITFGGGIVAEHVTLDPEVTQPVHFLEDGPLGGNDRISLEREEADYAVGGVLSLDVLKNDLAGTCGLDASSVRIVNSPRNGIARFVPATGQIMYAWRGDKAWVQDRFQYIVHDNNGVSTQRVEVLITR